MTGGEYLKEREWNRRHTDKACCLCVYLSPESDGDSGGRGQWLFDGVDGDEADPFRQFSQVDHNREKQGAHRFSS